VALLTAVMVLGWLWGPAGLLLATPLTVCLVVLGRHLPELELMSLIVGATPAFTPHLAYYERLIAGDRDEATEVVESFLAAHPPEHVFDQLQLPALSAMKADRLRNAITDTDRDRILHATRQIVDDTVLARGRQHWSCRDRDPIGDDVKERDGDARGDDGGRAGERCGR
jgi:hypothetical protein